MKTLRDPISSVTHLIGGFLSVLVTVLFMVKQIFSEEFHGTLFASTIIFGLALCLLYFTSGIYHAISATKVKLVKFMQKLDHSMIFVLIAGSYSPFCLYVLPKCKGVPLLIGLWFIALLGILCKIFWIDMPRVLSTGIYIIMGWAALFVVKDLYFALDKIAFELLVAGGLFYTIGGVIYSIQKPHMGKWSSHDIFHIFILLGSTAHVLLVYSFLLP